MNVNSSLLRVSKSLMAIERKRRHADMGRKSPSRPKLKPGVEGLAQANNALEKIEEVINKNFRSIASAIAKGRGIKGLENAFRAIQSQMDEYSAWVDAVLAQGLVTASAKKTQRDAKLKLKSMKTLHASLKRKARS